MYPKHSTETKKIQLAFKIVAFHLKNSIFPFPAEPGFIFFENTVDPGSEASWSESILFSTLLVDTTCLHLEYDKT